MRDDRRFLVLMLEAFRNSVLPTVPVGWAPDSKAHHGPVHETKEGLGVVMVMRAVQWRVSLRANGDDPSSDAGG